MMARQFLDELGGDVLASVSRSFYLSLRFLPGDLRAPISLAYLLARTSDTIADSKGAPTAIRIEELRRFQIAIANGEISGEPNLLPDSESERLLLKQSGRLIDWLNALAPEDRADIRAVLAKIIRGQEMDLVWFEDRSSLERGEQLEEYTYLVAGSVGEFWTRQCFRHVPNVASLTESEMLQLGCQFGKGLQLVNILRDLPEDLKAGRCYLPGGEVDARSLSHWIARAVNLLDAGFKYIDATASWRLRVATLLPWLLGMKTLALVKAQSPLEATHRLKVSRSELRKDMLGIPFLAASRPAMRGKWKALRSTFPESNDAAFR